MSSGESAEGSSLPTGMPLVAVPAIYRHVKHRKEDMPKLPSHRFRYSVWHDLAGVSVTDQLKAPRIREGPTEKDLQFYKITNENFEKIHHNYKGRQRKDYRNKMENWPNKKRANLSYQDLGNDYQLTNFKRVLKSLIRVETLQLMENSLVDIGSIHFPQCKYLNVNGNYIKSFKGLPTTPVIEHLLAEDNVIEDLEGLKLLSKTPLTSLSLKRNPVCFTLNYRHLVFSILPSLKVLDGIARQPDEERIEEDKDGRCSASCIVS